MPRANWQCCAAFLVRDLQIDWRWGAEHFESCLVDYTPDANWGASPATLMATPGVILTLPRELGVPYPPAPGSGELKVAVAATAL